MTRLVLALVLVALASALPHPFAGDSSTNHHRKENTATIKLESTADKSENSTLRTSANATKIAYSIHESPKNETTDKDLKHDRRTRETFETTVDKNSSHNKTSDKNDSSTEHSKINKHERVTRETSERDGHEGGAKQVVKKGQCEEESTTEDSQEAKTKVVGHEKLNSGEDSASIKLENESSRRHRREALEKNQANATIAEYSDKNENGTITEKPEQEKAKRHRRGVPEKDEEKVKNVKQKENDEDKTEIVTTTKKSDDLSKRHRRETLKIKEKNATVAESKENDDKSSTTGHVPKHDQNKRSSDKDAGGLNLNTTTEKSDIGKLKRERRDTSGDDEEEGKASDNKDKNKTSTENKEEATEKPKHGQLKRDKMTPPKDEEKTKTRQHEESDEHETKEATTTEKQEHDKH